MIHRMPARNSLNVSLTPELERFVQARVASGRYQTASEVVREGLRLLEVQERHREEVYKALKQKLQRAAAQAESGDLVDGEAFMDELIEKLSKRTPTAGR